MPLRAAAGAAVAAALAAADQNAAPAAAPHPTLDFLPIIQRKMLP